MFFALTATLCTTALFLGMLLFSEIGRRIGVARIARDPDGLTRGAGAAEAAVFGLLGLLIAFSFSGAASRFEARRHLIAEETNAIGTAYLRVDLLPADAQPEIRKLFGRYVDTRIATYADAEDLAATKARIAEGETLQGAIWKKSVAALQRPDAAPPATIMLVPALNEMIDITTTRVVATQNHPPVAVFLLLAGLSLIGAMLVGYGTSLNRDRSWLHNGAFAAILALTVYVIVDLEFPRLGLIRIHEADRILIDLRKTMP
ncbi:MAG: hypothetical protein ABWY48_00445 [Pseudoxanthomonas sp.]